MFITNRPDFKGIETLIIMIIKVNLITNRPDFKGIETGYSTS